MTWQDMLLSATVQTAFLAVLLFLARSILSHWLGKDLEAFKANLSATSQRTVETYKSELAREAREHQVRFERLHGNQVAAIEALYVRLVETRYRMESFVAAWQPDNRSEFAKMGRQFLRLRRELAKRRIHLPESLCAELDECIRSLWKVTVSAGVWPGVTDPAKRPRASEEFERSIKAILEGGSVEAAVAKVEREFRRALAGQLTMQ